MTNNEESKKVYTRKEAAAALQCGLNSLDALLRRRDNPLPSIQVGRRVLIPVSAFNKWLEAEAEVQREKAAV